MQEMQEMRLRSLGWEDPLEEKIATHSSILAWRTPRTEEPSGLQSMDMTENTCMVALRKTSRPIFLFWFRSTLFRTSLLPP